ncbi:MAG: glycosyltransferase family 4 protein [Patescibacteria group bacterium]
MLLGFFKHTPTVFGVHGTSIGRNLNSPLKSFLEKLILTKIHYTAQITVSRDFQKLKNINRKIFYVSNGVNIEAFEKVKAAKFNNPTLIFVGRLHFEKNLSNLIKAIYKAIEKIPNVKLLIVGSGPEEQALKRLIVKLKLKKNVIIVGQKTGQELIKLYKSSNIFILPSTYEGQPLVIFEAWAAKIPVIATKTGDIQFLLKENYNGFFINDPTNTIEIARVIIKALSAKNLVQLGENGFNFVKDNFTWEKSAAETLEVYKKIIKN